MTGLVVKDFLYLRKVAGAYLSIVVIYAVLCFTNIFEPSFMAGFLAIMVSMLPFSIFAYDSAAKWDSYGLALPVSRSRTVAARYVTVLLLMAVSLALVMAVGVVMAAVGKMPGWGEFLASAAACMVFSLLINAIMLPLLYKFGSEKARFMLFGVMGIIMLGGFLFLSVFDGVEWLASLELEAITGAQAALALAAAAGVALVLLFLSYLLSRYFYGKRDM